MAAGTQGSRQSCSASQMTHCPDTCSATGLLFLAKCQMNLRRFRRHQLSLCILLLTAQTSLGLQTSSGHLIRSELLRSFPDISPACSDLPRLEVKSSFSQDQSFREAVSASFYITQAHIEQNKTKPKRHGKCKPGRGEQNMVFITLKHAARAELQPEPSVREALPHPKIHYPKT